LSCPIGKFLSTATGGFCLDPNTLDLRYKIVQNFRPDLAEKADALFDIDITTSSGRRLTKEFIDYSISDLVLFKITPSDKIASIQFI
jgi:hypothetical protein